MPATPPPLPKRVASPRRLLAAQPRLWLPLLAWPLAVLFLVLVRRVLFPGLSTFLTVTEAVLVLSAIGALSLFAALALRFYRGLREVRAQLFGGKYETALELTRRHPALAVGLGLEGVLVRLLEFDSRRAEKVAAATRLFDRLLRELPVPILLADLATDTVRFSRALAALFGIADDRFDLGALLLPPANRHFAHLWSQLADGRKGTIDDSVTLQLPVRQATRRLHLRLLAIHDDQGKIAYILGIAQPPDQRGTNEDDAQDPTKGKDEPSSTPNQKEATRHADAPPRGTGLHPEK